MTIKFNTNNGRGKWACADHITASLKAPPIGQERSQTFCLTCPFEYKGPGCLFPSIYPTSEEADYDDRSYERRQAQVRAYDIRRHERKQTQARAQGMDTKGNLLSQSCWNCTALRQNGGGYVCGYTPDVLPVSRNKLYCRTPDKVGCNRFYMRLTVDIPELDDELLDELLPSAVGTVPTPPLQSGGDRGQVAPTAEGASPPPPSAQPKILELLPKDSKGLSGQSAPPAGPPSGRRPAP